MIRFRPEHEKEEAEKLGLGIITGSTFTLKQNLQDDIKNICMPRATTKEVTGIVTHVSRILQRKKMENISDKFRSTHLGGKLLEILASAGK